jgi:glycosyltransferase involved in cell wall biosynthesis
LIRCTRRDSSSEGCGMTPVPSSTDPRFSNRLRVLFINDTSRNGGPGRTLFTLLKCLDPADVHRAVLLPREGVVADLLREGGVADELFFEPAFVENAVEPWDRPIVRGDFDAPLRVRSVRAVGNVARGAAAVAKMAMRAKTGGYDLVFCNGTSANFAGGAIAAMTGIPALWHVFYTQLAPAIAPVHARLAMSRSVRSIVCVSEPTTRLFSHVKGKVRIVHDAIDVADYDVSHVAPILRAELGLPADAVVFGSHGRILPRKGYAEMVRAARVAMDAMTSEERARARFVVLGDTPDDIRPDHLEECRALVSELRLEGAFFFPGYRPDVRPYVGDFDAAVVPSVYDDPLPRAVLESMALSKPVVAFDVGGISEMVADGVTGTLVRGSPPDVPALAAAMLAYLRAPELRLRHGTAGRARVLRDFDPWHHAQILLREMRRITCARG